MNTSFGALAFLLCFAFALQGQVEIPQAYMNRFPYYLGNTKLEIENYHDKNLHYINLDIDASLLDTTGVIDASTVIQSFLDKAAEMAINDTIVTVNLPHGSLNIRNELRISSNTVLKGHDKKTRLLINTGENRHGILIAPKSLSIQSGFRLVNDVLRGDREILVQTRDYQAYKSACGQPAYITLQYLDDKKLLSSEWAKGCIREHYFVAAVETSSKGTLIKLGHPLAGIDHFKPKQDISLGVRRNFAADTSLSLAFVQNSVMNAGVMDLVLIRIDSTASQTSNIMLDQAYNCLISGVRSFKCNFAHICIQNSAFNIVKRCDLRESHGYGSGGRAYGVMLQMGSSSNVVMDNYFSKLRHSMILQAGANGNVVYANLSEQQFWSEGAFPKDAAGDIVLHGNYVYANLFEMNNAGQIVIDDSHGKNGPYNIFFRNRLNNYGILISAGNGGDSQVFVGNEITSTVFLKGLYILKDKGHFEYGNQVKGKVAEGQTEGTYPSFLWKPECGPGKDYSPICFPAVQNAPYGFPFDMGNDSLPVAQRIYGHQTSKDSYDRQFDEPLSSTADLRTTEIHIYPNPAKGNLMINAGQEGVLYVIDNQGKQLKMMTLEQGSNSISLGELAPGLYILCFTGVNGLNAVQKLVLQ